jgi:hypothetical protein
MSTFRQHDRAWAGTQAVLACVREKAATSVAGDLVGDVYRILRRMIEEYEHDARHERARLRATREDADEAADT